MLSFIFSASDKIACITGALLAKRGKRGILSETRNVCALRFLFAFCAKYHVRLVWLVIKQHKHNQVPETSSLSQVRTYMFNAAGWCVAIVVALSTLYGEYSAVRKDNPKPFTRAEDIIYGTFSHCAWSLALAWVIFACHRRLGGKSCFDSSPVVSLSLPGGARGVMERRKARESVFLPIIPCSRRARYAKTTGGESGCWFSRFSHSLFSHSAILSVTETPGCHVYHSSGVDNETSEA